MIASPKEWASLLGFDRDSDEKTMAARTRVLARALAYLDEHFTDPDGARPPEALVMELGQYLALAESMEAKVRGTKFKELYETIIELHVNWDEIDRDAAFENIAKEAALFRGIVAFSDAWLGTETAIPSRRRHLVEATALFDDADVKTRIVPRSQAR